MKIPLNEAISPLVLKAVEDDITVIDTDAMVNSANTAMVLGGSRSVASRINELTEGRVESILADDEVYPKPVPLGEVCVTEADILPCSFVFHLSTHGNLQEMVNAANKLGEKEELQDRMQRVLLNSIKLGVSNLLRECEERHLNRMTMPLIGTGTLNLPKLLAIEVLVGTLTTQLLERPPQFLKEISIVTPESTIFGFLKDYLDTIEIDVHPEEESDLIMNGGPNLENFSLLHLKSSVLESKDFKEEPTEMESASPQSVAYEAIEEISSLKKKLAEINRKNRNLEKQNKEFSEETKKLLTHNRELEQEILLLNRNVMSPQEAWSRSDLPLPLAYAQDILNSEEDPNRSYLNSITAIGIVHKYFFSLVCAEYKAAGCFNREINELLNERFRQNSITDGSWHWVGLNIARAFQDENKNGNVIENIVNIWLQKDGTWSRFSDVLKKLINLRNEIHDPVGADNSRALDWLAKFSPLWEEMCTLSASLLNYELVYIDSIQNFLPGERIRYAVKHLRGGYSVPQSGTLDLVEQYNPEELFLRDPANDRMLALSPFVVYEYSQVTNSREAYCIDHIQHSRVHFRAFRYAHFHYEDHEGVGPFFNDQ